MYDVKLLLGNADKVVTTTSGESCRNGLGPYDVNQMNVNTLFAQIQGLVRIAVKREPAMAHWVEGCRLAVDEHYELPFGASIEEPALDEAIVAS